MAPITPKQYVDGMRFLCGGVTLITTQHEGKNIGLTATAVSSLCAEPPRLLVCVNRKGISYNSIQKSRIFGVNILSSKQVDMAKRFAGMIDIGDKDRFEAGLWASKSTGAPLLKDAIVAFDCEVESLVETGTHGIIIGNVIGVDIMPGDPLLYMDGGFKTSASL